MADSIGDKMRQALINHSLDQGRQERYAQTKIEQGVKEAMAEFNGIPITPLPPQEWHKLTQGSWDTLPPSNPPPTLADARAALATLERACTDLADRHALAAELAKWVANPLTMIARSRGWLPLVPGEHMTVHFEGQRFVILRKDDPS